MSEVVELSKLQSFAEAQDLLSLSMEEAGFALQSLARSFGVSSKKIMSISMGTTCQFCGTKGHFDWDDINEWHICRSCGGWN